ncbi:MAG TPA: polymer-forming cytoskeletal protein [Candidatus Acidoferrales bacterium]|nr:polymer-forming cytoskeletal protein [Candidatus Acidoferrales bacterium]
MWNKPAEAETPSTRPAQSNSFAASPAAVRPAVPTARSMSCLGSGLEIRGTISGSEDLQIDGKVHGPISLQGQKLTIGHTGKVQAEVSARDVIVYGDITGNLQAQDRVEIKKDASVIGDIKATRISIEDGAYCKGRIEIDRGGRSSSSGVGSSSTVSSAEPESVTALVPVGAN